MSDVRWEGFSHEEIYSRVQQGPGPLASADAEAAWSTVESTIRTVDAQLTRAVKQIGAGWQGRAAEAVQGGMTVMSNWALDAAGDASLTKNGISAQAEQAGRLRSAMPPPRTAEWNRIVQEEVPGVGLVSAMGDLGALEEQMADDHAVAVEMMNRYSSQSSDNQRLMNYWTQPPTVVVEAASARSTTSTAPLGAAGAVGARSGAGGVRTGSPADGSSSGRGVDPSSAAVPARSGSRTSPVAAPSAGGSGGAGTPAEIGPPNGEGSGRVGSAAVPGRAPGAVDPYADTPVGRRRDGSRNRRRPWRSRRGASNKHDPRRSPPGRRGPGAGCGRTVAAIRSFRRRRRPPRGTRATRPARGCRRLAHRPAHRTRHSTRHRRAAGSGAAHPRSRRRRTAAPRRRSRRGSRRRAGGRGTLGLRGPRDPADGRCGAAHGAGARAGGLPDRRHRRVRRRPLVPAAGDQRRCAGVAAGRLMCRSTDTARPSYPTHRHRTAGSGWLGRR